jgi:hypothetical protein
MPEEVKGIKGKEIKDSDIELNFDVINRLRDI